ncbi:hypothetical protein BSKO_00446 [Bryopsis sp. KO-2023]|nr:hypothetical protein BSKO_00446 [Bryopsis sp. KO-2023]
MPILPMNPPSSITPFKVSVGINFSFLKHAPTRRVHRVARKRWSDRMGIWKDCGVRCVGGASAESVKDSVDENKTSRFNGFANVDESSDIDSYDEYWDYDTDDEEGEEEEEEEYDSSFDEEIEDMGKVKGGSSTINGLIEREGALLHKGNVSSIFPYKLDKFQKEAINEILAKKSVVVSAPTGAGKTAIAEAAAVNCLCQEKRIIYTTPLKALSNQKLYEFEERFGAERVGLVTGDTSIRPHAQIIVMTTEILRNIMYSIGEIEAGRLDDVGSIVLDEVHYLSDPHRGTVWEELIVGCPKHIRLLCMSATVANPVDLGDWITQIHGECSTVTTNKRPVPLRWYFAFKNNTHTKIESLLDKKKRKLNKKVAPKSTSRRDMAPRVPSMEGVANALDENDLLPAIVFIFSRKECDNSATSLSSAGVSLTSQKEKEAIIEEIEKLRAEQPEAIRHKLVKALIGGITSHHAGCLPGWKGLVENLFQQGLIKLIYATETLAAGINMPARTTVISKVSRRRGANGVQELMHNELLQMAGRAGRRGYDTLGNCIILQTLFDGPQVPVGIISKGPEPLTSQFRSGYSLVLNLLQMYELEGAKKFVQRSFRSYLAGMGLRRREQEIKKLKKEVAALTKEVEKSLTNNGCSSEEEFRSAQESFDIEKVELERLVQLGKKARATSVENFLKKRDFPVPVLLDTSVGTGAKTEILPVLVLAYEDSSSAMNEDWMICLGADNQFYKTQLISLVGIYEDVYYPSQSLEEIDRMLLDVKSMKWKKLNKRVFSVRGSVHTAKLAFKIPRRREMIEVKYPNDISERIENRKERLTEANAQLVTSMRHKVKQSRGKNSAQQRLMLSKRKLKASSRMVRDLESYRKASWADFMGITEILKKSGALHPESLKIRPLGEVSREIHGDNELWLALALTHPSTQLLNEASLAGFIASLVAADCASKPQISASYPPPEKVVSLVLELESIQGQLFEWESLYVGAPLGGSEMDVRLSGVVVAWAQGCNWDQIMKGTSLDDGDVARLLTRTLDMLRQISGSKFLLADMKNAARKAYVAMNRSPLKDILK